MEQKDNKKEEKKVFLLHDEQTKIPPIQYLHATNPHSTIIQRASCCCTSQSSTLVQPQIRIYFKTAPTRIVGPA
jgi:hypothetical protein